MILGTSSNNTVSRNDTGACAAAIRLYLHVVAQVTT